MPRLYITIAVVVLILVGCQGSSNTPQELPTIVQFPTETNTPLASPTAIDTATATQTQTPETTATYTAEPTNTRRPTDTPIPTQTIDPTVAVRGTSTAMVVEAPVFSTFTPVPPGAIAVVARPTSTGTPEILADVIITEGQFQEEINRLIIDKPAISLATVAFVETGVEYTLTIDNNGVFVSGTVSVPFTFSGGSFNNIVSIGGTMDIALENTGEPTTNEQGTEIPPAIPEEFVVSATDIVVATQEAFNFILNQRLGEGNHDLENIIIADRRMFISLVVPVTLQ